MESPTDILDPAILVTAGIATASKPYRDGKGHFLKWSRGGNAAKVRREWDFLMTMAASGVTPQPIRYGSDFILMQDLGDPEPVPVEEHPLVAPAAQVILDSLLAKGIRHNDLRPQNLIWHDHKLYCIDFGRSTWASEKLGNYRATEDVILIRDSVTNIIAGKVWK